MFSFTAQDWDWTFRFVLICIAFPLAFLRFLSQEGYWPRVFGRGSFASDAVEEINREFRKFFLRCLKGPVLFCLLLGALAFFWQAKYEQAVEGFQEQLLQERDTHKKANEIWRERFVGASLLRDRDEALLARELTKSMMKSHPRGYHSAKDQLIFQQLEGYDEKGTPIWSKEVHVFRVHPEVLRVEKRVLLLPGLRASEPAMIQELYQALAHGQEISRRTWGQSFKAFEATEDTPRNRHFDVRIQMRLQVEGESGVYLHHFYENFPPSPGMSQGR